MKRWSRLASVALSACVFTAGATPLGALDLSTGSSGFQSNPAVGGFSDRLTFTLATTSVVNGSLISASNGTRDVDLTKIVVTGPSGLFSFSKLANDPFESFGLSSRVLGPGTYTIDLIGTNGAAGGSYGGNFAVTPLSGPSPVAGGAARGAVNLDLSTGGSGFSNTPVLGSFSDRYLFTLAAPTLVSSGLTAAVNGTQNVTFSSVSVTGPGGTFAFTPIAADPFEATALSAFLTPGTYSLDVTGTNNGGGGSYGGNLTLSGSGTTTAPPANTGRALDLTTGSTGFANTPTLGGFSDVFTFTLAQNTFVNGSLFTPALGSRDVTFDSAIVSGPSGVFSFSLLNGDPFETLGLSGVVLAPGAYTLNLIGTNSGAGASYGGNLAATPLTPLPPGGGGAAGGPVPLDLSTGSSGFFNTPILGAFTDTFTFTLGAATFLEGGLTSALNGAQDVDFTAVFLTGPDGVFNFTAYLADPFESEALRATFFRAGAYTLTVSGVNRGRGGSYGGAIVLTSLAPGVVPEPSSLALFAIAAAGAALARRSRRARGERHDGQR